MEHTIVTTTGPMVIHSLRLHRGDDLMLCIKEAAAQKNIRAGVILSAVGCILEGRLRDASGVNIRSFQGHYEIVSLTGTVSAARTHLHIALSGEDISTIGGHLCPGCIVNTTCELILGELPDLSYGVEEDPETGYDEIIFSLSK